MGLVLARDRRLPGLDRRACPQCGGHSGSCHRRPRKAAPAMAREIAAACVLVAAFGSGSVTAIVLFWKLAELLGWVR